MKFRHYYASERFEEYNCPQPCPEKLATHQLTKMMVDTVFFRHATGPTPYRLYVARSILYEAHTWKYPETLLTIHPKREEDDDTNAIATADMVFAEMVVFIHARRCLPMPPLESIKGFHVKYFDELEWGNAKC